MTDIRLTAETTLLRRVRRKNPLARLVCLPHAGAGASYFSEWARYLPEEIELVTTQLPGREDRIREAAPSSVRPLAMACAFGLGVLPAIPTVLFGHSGGAIFAYELAQALDVKPVHLFVSGQRAPHILNKLEPLHGLPDSEFVEKLRWLGGTPQGVLDNPDLVDLVLPTLRADFMLWENYSYSPRSRLDMPITVFSGDQDPSVSDADVHAWQDHTTHPLTTRSFAGGHFFLEKYLEEILQNITKILLA